LFLLDLYTGEKKKLAPVKIVMLFSCIGGNIALLSRLPDYYSMTHQKCCRSRNWASGFILDSCLFVINVGYLEGSAESTESLINQE
jgi:hypothetical protein